MAIAEVVDLLTCPHCRQPLTLGAQQRSAGCDAGHSFDLARQGYLNLSRGKAPRNADTSAMVAARDRFLAAGHYRLIADRLGELAAAHCSAGSRSPWLPPGPTVLEVGAGTGYYLAQVLEALPGSRGVALDVSVAAARRSAESHPRIGSVVADVWQPMPLADGCVDVLLDVFAPRNADEFARLLSRSGLVLVVTPGPEHLAEIRSTLGLLNIQPNKGEQLRAALAPRLVAVTEEPLHFELALEVDSLRDLVAMGPNAFHHSESEVAELVESVVMPRRVTAAVSISVWRPR